jgi:hypothetical protein
MPCIESDDLPFVPPLPGANVDKCKTPGVKPWINDIAVVELVAREKMSASLTLANISLAAMSLFHVIDFYSVASSFFIAPPDFAYELEGKAHIWHFAAVENLLKLAVDILNSHPAPLTDNEVVALRGLCAVALIFGKNVLNIPGDAYRPMFDSTTHFYLCAARTGFILKSRIAISYANTHAGHVIVHGQTELSMLLGVALYGQLKPRLWKSELELARGVHHTARTRDLSKLRPLPRGVDKEKLRSVDDAGAYFARSYHTICGRGDDEDDSSVSGLVPELLKSL